MSFCQLFFFPAAAFQLIVTVKKSTSNPNISQTKKPEVLDTCKIVITPVPGSGITISSGNRMVSELAVRLQWVEVRTAAASLTSPSLSSHVLLVALAGAWEVHGNRLEPKAGHIFY